MGPDGASPALLAGSLLVPDAVSRSGRSPRPRDVPLMVNSTFRGVTATIGAAALSLGSNAVISIAEWVGAAQ